MEPESSATPLLVVAIFEMTVIAGLVLFCLSDSWHDEVVWYHDNPLSLSAEFEFRVSGLTVTVDEVSKSGPQRIQWDFGDGFLSSDAQVRHTYPSSGTYTISLTAWKGDCESTADITIQISNDDWAIVPEWCS